MLRGRQNCLLGDPWEQSNAAISQPRIHLILQTIEAVVADSSSAPIGNQLVSAFSGRSEVNRLPSSRASTMLRSAAESGETSFWTLSSSSVSNSSFKQSCQLGCASMMLDREIQEGHRKTKWENSEPKHKSTIAEFPPHSVTDSEFLLYTWLADVVGENNNLFNRLVTKHAINLVPKIRAAAKPTLIDPDAIAGHCEF